MSEVITRTRQYMMELVGGQGNVMTHHKTIKDLEQYYSSISDNKDVKEFLKNITSDKEGYCFKTKNKFILYVTINLCFQYFAFIPMVWNR